MPCCCRLVAKWCLTLRLRRQQAALSFTIGWSLLKLMSIESLMLSNHLILCCPLVLLPSTFPSIWVFSNELALHIRWPEYWSFSINPFNEYSGLISFRVDWFDLLEVQGTQESSPTPQFKSINSKKKIKKHHSSVLSLLYGPTLISIHDYWKSSQHKEEYLFSGYLYSRVRICKVK